MTAGFNNVGSYRTTRVKMMRAFDRLPREAREALANSIDNFVSQPLVTMLRRGASADLLIKSVLDWDKQELRKRRQDTFCARGVYKGNAPARASQPGRPS